MDKTLKKYGAYAAILSFALWFALVIELVLLFVNGGHTLLIIIAALAAVGAAVNFILARRMQRMAASLQYSLQNERTMVVRDALTDVYDQDTSLYLINRFLQMEGVEGVHGLLMLDIDGLAAINESRGTDYGDMVLMTTAERIKQLFRKTDIVGRLGEDEFIIFLKNIDSRVQLQSQAAALVAELESNAETTNQHITCGVGGALYPEDAHDCAAMLQKAESALDRAKQKGNGSFALYNPKTDDVFAMENF